MSVVETGEGGIMKGDRKAVVVRRVYWNSKENRYVLSSRAKETFYLYPNYTQHPYRKFPVDGIVVLEDTGKKTRVIRGWETVWSGKKMNWTTRPYKTKPKTLWKLVREK